MCKQRSLSALETSMNFFIMNNSGRVSRNKQGFTLVETLVAISILMIAITGPLTIASKALTTALTSRDQVIATFLVQDVHEYIHNIKDRNLYRNNPWLQDLGNGTSCTVSSPCIIDTSGVLGSPAAATAVSGNNTQLYRDSIGRYTHVATNNTRTIFNRQFYIEELPLQDLGQTYQARVVVKVSWMNAGSPFETTFDTYIYRTVQ